MIIGERITGRLKAINKSQAALARYIGVSPQAISKMATGNTHDTAKLWQIAKFCRTSPEFLTGEVDDPDRLDEPMLLSEEQREWVQLLDSIRPSDRKAALQIVRSLAAMHHRPDNDAQP